MNRIQEKFKALNDRLFRHGDFEFKIARAIAISLAEHHPFRGVIPDHILPQPNYRLKGRIIERIEIEPAHDEGTKAIVFFSDHRTIYHTEFYLIKAIKDAKEKAEIEVSGIVRNIFE